MGGVCTVHGREKKIHARFWCENLKEGELMEDQRVDGRVILKFISKK